MVFSPGPATMSTRRAGAVVSDAHAGRLFLLSENAGAWRSREIGTDRTPSPTGGMRFPEG